MNMEYSQSIKVLAVIPGLIPSTIISIIRPLTDLHRKRRIHLRVIMESDLQTDKIDWPDLVILCRNTSPTLIPFLNTWYEKKIPIIYELDDNLFEIPSDLSDFARIICQTPHQQTIYRLVQQASLVRVYSHPIKDRVSSITPFVEMIRPPLDWKLIRQPKLSYDSSIVKIVYATSRTKDDNLAEVFLPALIHILELYKNSVRVYFLGSNPLKQLKDRRIRYKPFRLNYSSYLRRFSGAGYDIGLAPLKNDIFHRSKTNVKYREYGASHIAGIYSDVDVYSDWINDGENGLLVENTEESWFNAMQKLIINKDIRDRIKDSAYKDVRSNFSQEQFSEKWWEHIQLVLSKKEIPNILESHFDSYSNPYVSQPFAETSISSWKRILKVFHESGIREGIDRFRNRLYIIIQMKILQLRLSIFS
jgi:glycosyltransferase involved in cell wall biosynthesis